MDLYEAISKLWLLRSHPVKEFFDKFRSVKLIQSFRWLKAKYSSVQSIKYFMQDILISKVFFFNMAMDLKILQSTENSVSVCCDAFVWAVYKCHI